ncbi:MAG: heme exporter protein CcmB [Planctomycetes bacterium]|nr:heme exporter protein CcmB [Planctomycetota bacterium]
MADTPATATPSSVRALALLLAREFRTEFRTRSLLASQGLFAATSVIALALGSRALPHNETFQRFALSAIWVCVLFAAVVGLNRSALAERERGLNTSFRLLPVDPAVLYTVRLCSALAFLIVTEVIIFALGALLLDVNALADPLIPAIILLADIGFLAPGVLLATATSEVRGGEALLAVALIPLTIPVLAGAIGAWDALGAGLGFAGAQPYVLLLGCCAAMFLALGLLLYGKLSE